MKVGNVLALKSAFSSNEKTLISLARYE